MAHRVGRSMTKTLPTESGTSFWIAWPLALGLQPPGPPLIGDSEKAPRLRTGERLNVEAWTKRRESSPATEGWPGCQLSPWVPEQPALPAQSPSRSPCPTRHHPPARTAPRRPGRQTRRRATVTARHPTTPARTTPRLNRSLALPLSFSRLRPRRPRTTRRQPPPGDPDEQRVDDRHRVDPATSDLGAPSLAGPSLPESSLERPSLERPSVKRPSVKLLERDRDHGPHRRHRRSAARPRPGDARR
jgi:hypothetical protein